MAEPLRLPDPLDNSAEQHPRADQGQCLARAPRRARARMCQFPLHHAGDHVCGGDRWPRR
jgi:hypothetical protein